MTDRMSEIKGFTNTFFFWVFFHDPLFHSYRLGNQLIEKFIINRGIRIKEQYGSVNFH